jgi:DNA topoisomerase-1
MAGVCSAFEPRARTDSKSGRRKQVLGIVRHSAEQLANTPTFCRKSYVPDAVVGAFENGVLKDYAQALRTTRVRE